MKTLLFSAVFISAASALAAPTLPLTHTDTLFLPKAAMSNTFEIEAAQLALKITAVPADVTFARQMIADHTRIGAEVKAAVAKVDSSYSLPGGVSKAQQRMLDRLKAAGKNFDRLYKTDMLRSHAQAIRLFEKYTASSTANPTLKAAAMKALPTIKMHHDEAKTLAEK